MVRYVIIITVLLMVFILGILPWGEHVSHGWWDRIPGFEALFGFFGCVVIIVVSKGLGHLFIQKKEDYYRE
jgi:hypothetical protein